MNRLMFLIALLGLTALVAITGYDHQVSYDLKLVHLNAHWLYATEVGLPPHVAANDFVVNSPAKRRKHIQSVTNYLLSTNADLIHLTEVQGATVLQTITDALNRDMDPDAPQYSYYLVNDAAAQGREGIYQRVAFISRLPMIGNPSRSSAIMDDVGHRFYQHIVAKFALPDGRSLFAAGVHLKRQPQLAKHHSYEMEQFIKELTYRCAKVDNANHVIAVLGDFNEVLPLGRKMDELSCDYEIKKHYKLVNPVQFHMMQGLGAYVKESSGIGLIDSILVSSSFASNNEPHPVVKGMSWVRQCYDWSLSDHSPVELYFRVNQPVPKSGTAREPISKKRNANSFYALSTDVDLSLSSAEEVEAKNDIDMSVDVVKTKSEKSHPGTTPKRLKLASPGKSISVSKRRSRQLVEPRNMFFTILIRILYRFPYGLTAMIITVSLIIYHLRNLLLKAVSESRLKMPNRDAKLFH